MISPAELASANPKIFRGCFLPGAISLDMNLDRTRTRPVQLVSIIVHQALMPARCTSSKPTARPALLTSTPMSENSRGREVATFQTASVSRTSRLSEAKHRRVHQQERADGPFSVPLQRLYGPPHRTDTESRWRSKPVNAVEFHVDRSCLMLAQSSDAARNSDGKRQAVMCKAKGIGDLSRLTE